MPRTKTESSPQLITLEDVVNMLKDQLEIDIDIRPEPWGDGYVKTKVTLKLGNTVLTTASANYRYER
jgi:hypothetical protein